MASVAPPPDRPRRSISFNSTGIGGAAPVAAQHSTPTEYGIAMHARSAVRTSQRESPAARLVLVRACLASTQPAGRLHMTCKLDLSPRAKKRTNRVGERRTRHTASIGKWYALVPSGLVKVGPAASISSIVAFAYGVHRTRTLRGEPSRGDL